MSQVPSVKLNDNHLLPMLGLGTSRLEGAYGAVKSALELGYRHIDTAAMYGNEGEVGRAVRDSGIPRSEIFVTTKLANDSHDDVAGALKQSLDRLDIEYIDLYLIHWPMPKRVASWITLEKLISAGAAVKSIGVSNFTTRHLKELLTEAKTVPAVNQVEFNPFVYKPEGLKFNRNQGIQLVAYSPLTRGHKTDNETLVAVAKSANKSVSQVMLRWCVQHGVAVIPKATSLKHQQANMQIFDWELSATHMTELDGLFDGFRVTEDPEAYP